MVFALTFIGFLPDCFAVTVDETSSRDILAILAICIPIRVDMFDHCFLVNWLKENFRRPFEVTERCLVDLL